MKRFKIKKLNNQGSTFILSLLVITLLTTLAFALANASISNMMMKSIDRNAKTNFYTAESLLDEVRAGIGKDSINNLSVAYEGVLTNLVKYSSTGSSVKDNAKANDEMKALFIDNMLKQITNGKLSFGPTDQSVTTSISSDDARDEAKRYIQGHIKGTQYENDMGEVTSIGDIKAYKNPEGTTDGYKWIVIIEDVAFSYKEKIGGEVQFSNITTDIEIEYPNMTVDFTATNRITDFINYSLIADNNIVISGQTVTVENGSVYAGDTIDIGPSSIQKSNVVFKTLNETDPNINVVCGGNNGGGTISVGGNSTVQSQVHFQGANIWCTNIVTKKASMDNDKGAVITIGDRCKTYVKDDFTAEAQNSNITIEGEYYGYMNEGGEAEQKGHGKSSAIIVNGKNTKMTIGASKLMIGGFAYIDIKSSGATPIQYMTGEALSLKGSQEVYLVPSEFLGDGYDGSIQNPTSKDAWKDLKDAAKDNDNITLCKIPDNYFAKKYLNDNPIIEKEVDGMMYLYWNFTSKSAEANFIKDVVEGKNAETAKLRNILIKYNNKLLTDDTIVKVDTAESKIDATGIFIQSENGVPSYKASKDPSNPMSFTLASNDLANRYDIITHLLATLPWEIGNATYIVTNPITSLEQLKGISITNSDLSDNTIIDTIIDMDRLVDAGIEYNPNAIPVKYGTSDKYYAKVAVNTDNYYVPDGISYGNKCISGGIIIARGNVILNHNFDGLIIAGGDIILNGGAVLTTNPNLIEEFILGKEEFYDDTVTEEGYEFRHYFRAYKSGATEEDSREEIKIENINYKDLVSFDNWRKYEYEKFPKTTE